VCPDIANAILYFSSAEFDFITGQQIVVDGGFSLKAG
jgi:NAD(P)-dependent dehydrogenase (short-subunit alcohol dehydrogenase family)